MKALIVLQVFGLFLSFSAYSLTGSYPGFVPGVPSIFVSDIGQLPNLSIVQVNDKRSKMVANTKTLERYGISKDQFKVMCAEGKDDFNESFEEAWNASRSIARGHQGISGCRYRNLSYHLLNFGTNREYLMFGTQKGSDSAPIWGAIYKTVNAKSAYTDGAVLFFYSTWDVFQMHGLHAQGAYSVPPRWVQVSKDPDGWMFNTFFSDGFEMERQLGTLDVPLSLRPQNGNKQNLVTGFGTEHFRGIVWQSVVGKERSVEKVDLRERIDPVRESSSIPDICASGIRPSWLKEAACRCPKLPGESGEWDGFDQPGEMNLRYNRNGLDSVGGSWADGRPRALRDYLAGLSSNPELMIKHLEFARTQATTVGQKCFHRIIKAVRGYRKWLSPNPYGDDPVLSPDVTWSWGQRMESYLASKIKPDGTLDRTYAHLAMTFHVMNTLAGIEFTGGKVYPNAYRYLRIDPRVVFTLSKVQAFINRVFTDTSSGKFLGNNFFQSNEIADNRESFHASWDALSLVNDFYQMYGDAIFDRWDFSTNKDRLKSVLQNLLARSQPQSPDAYLSSLGEFCDRNVESFNPRQPQDSSGYKPAEMTTYAKRNYLEFTGNAFDAVNGSGLRNLFMRLGIDPGGYRNVLSHRDRVKTCFLNTLKLQSSNRELN